MHTVVETSIASHRIGCQEIDQLDPIVVRQQANVTPDQLRRIADIVAKTKSGTKGAGDD